MEPSRSFTLRIPSDLDAVFRERVEERQRSRFLVALLRRSLGLDAEANDQIAELTTQLEAMQRQQDEILERLAILESRCALNGQNPQQMTLFGD